MSAPSQPDRLQRLAERQRAILAEHQQAQQRALLARRLRSSGMEGNARMLAASFDSYRTATEDQAAVLRACRTFATETDFASGGGLWLIGPPGTGKTHLGSAMVHHVIRERDAQGCIHSAREIVRMLRAGWGGQKAHSNGWGDTLPATEEEVIEHLGTAELLVVDEIGASMGSDAERVQLFEVIDARYRRFRPTVVLSNLNPEDMRRTLGQRSYDRLREGASMLHCGWDSYRGTSPQ